MIHNVPEINVLRQTESVPAEGGVFLSPEWIRQVVDVVEEAKRQDPYLGGLVSQFNFRVLYVIEDLPRKVRSLYGRGSKIVVCVTLRNGAVANLKIGSRVPSLPADLIVTLKYDLAAKLFRGDVGVASTLLSGQVRPKPANGFTAWTKIAAKSLVAVPQVLKAARKIPTRFVSES